MGFRGVAGGFVCEGVEADYDGRAKVTAEAKDGRRGTGGTKRRIQNAERKTMAAMAQT